ncbi:hypothetical protein BT96DRAFT_995894 [Gymnopus androsaceus JB14]|uniref:Uncharacterized protein n=1 Tax=Gymnopus androsaceus JB14 TaxID=1447944 RepID=A0A6A4HH17_9AGAR|nr:hypothetical protein BT96DRAFT_995894 [Gymnopus androsaceus JB14]
MGQAGTPYMCSVPIALQTNLKNRPDASLVLDTLLKRLSKPDEKDVEADGFTPHPGGPNPTVSDASSYLDLSVVYGSTEA